ncbi:hypothetical protein J2N86_11635 [Legionella lytica]|uniref:Substrate of the Dot/Icm secretion system n=1 Tax=Legionella lytica TaxID=96232 RepID=A0ABY4Y6Y3_9GAMM|nr:hypothetical protein [Legionella lytica]USQ13330.1 hypothetical protein J2N86_11635 [Legionella lytica]
MGKKTSDLKKMLSSKNIDTSDFILIALDILHNEKSTSNEPEQLTSLIKECKQNYLDLDYEATTEKLITVARTLADKSIAGLLESTAKRAAKNSNPEKVQSRRYFENHLVNEQWASLNNESHKDSMDRFAKFMAGANLLYSEQENFAKLKKVNNLEDMEMVIAAMRGFGEKTESILSRESSMRKEENEPLSKFKDRGRKRDSKDVGDTLNPGIIKANTPTPVDELREKAVTGSITDSFLINKKIESGYSSTNVDVPFVNSVSGTAYTLAAVLDQYIEQNSKEPNLQTDVNNIVQVFVSFTCKSGFHSLSEMADVLRSPEVEEVFRKHNLNINYSCPIEILDETIKASTQYAETRAAQKMSLHELHSQSLFNRHSGEKPTGKAYPHELQMLVREEKQSGPRVARALKELYQNEKYGPDDCKDIAQRYLNYATAKHPHANTRDVKEFIKEMNTAITKRIDTTEDRIEHLSPGGMI